MISELLRLSRLPGEQLTGYPPDLVERLLRARHERGYTLARLLVHMAHCESARALTVQAPVSLPGEQWGPPIYMVARYSGHTLLAMRAVDSTDWAKPTPAQAQAWADGQIRIGGQA